MRKYFFWIIILLIIIFGGTFGFHFLRNAKMAEQLAARGSLHPVISTVAAVKKDYQPVLPSVGSLTAFKGIDLTSQVNGEITKIMFVSGRHTKQGDALVQLDDRLAREAYNMDKATLAYDKVNYLSQKALIKNNATSQNEVDSAQATYMAQKAKVAQDKINLDDTTIRAPFSGKLGLRQVDVGQYITTSTVIVSLQQLDPMYVDFPLSSNLLSQFKSGQAVHVEVNSQPGKIYNGKIVAVDSLVDESTRTVNVRASIKNDDESLLPGQFADISVLLPVQKDVVEVPRAAITYSLYGNAVLLVTEKEVDGKTEHIATEKYVTTGDVDGENVVILKGLNAGDVIVSSGQNKVSSGGVVTINNSTPSTDDSSQATTATKTS
ncbi:MAG: efflux transporter periplasmic adaptor subunit [Coxiellaceae bacterium]|nr:efflux transporter periplasmic adaptor subunit [Coxiellaceae bacterium]